MVFLALIKVLIIDNTLSMSKKLDFLFHGIKKWPQMGVKDMIVCEIFITFAKKSVEMNIGILHLSDLHIKQESEFWASIASKIVSATRNDFHSCDKIFLICSGDIAFSGKEEEYRIAARFFNALKSLLNQFHDCKCNDLLILVPGNHDCNFTTEPQVRKVLIDNLSYENLGKDYSVINPITVVQDEFFSFVESINGETVDSRLAYEYKVDIEGFSISFLCLNSAWCSRKNEIVGGLFYPIELIKENIKADAAIKIAVIHHHPAWLTPNSSVNNRIEFTDFVNAECDLVLLGHEHSNNIEIGSDSQGKPITRLVSGDALYANWNGLASGFQTLIIDTDSRTVSQHNYHLKNVDSIYYPTAEFSFELRPRYSIFRDFVSNEDFISSFSTIEIPLVKESKTVSIDNLFIYPNIETAEDLKKDIDAKYKDSSSLLEGSSKATIILEGDNQSGKTSLLKKLYLDSLKKGLYPLFLNGEEFKSGKIDTILRRAYNIQYVNKDYEVYNQFSTDKKIVFIDDITNIGSNNNIPNLVSQLSTRFARIYISTSPRYDFLTSIETLKKGVFYGRILPLGFKKRGELIETYYKLSNPNWSNISTQQYIEDTKKLIEEVQNVLGNKIIPSCPIFIISILQSMKMMQPANIEQTSYGYCYQTLIHYALAVKAKISNEDIGSYFNYLSELAYYIYKNYQEDNSWLSKRDLEKFHNAYVGEYVFKDFSQALSSLLESNIIVVNSDDEYRFGYPYIYYFLVAQKIASNLANSQGGKDLKFLCDNLHEDKCANILIFVTYHTKDRRLIDEATFATMLPFDTISPITLDKDKEYYNLLESLADDLSDSIIAKDINPLQERKKRWEEKDKIEQLLPDNKDNADLSTLPQELIVMRQAMRSIEIVGQIIKNSKGSLPKKQLESMVKELFFTAFRTIGFFGKLVSQSKDEIIESIKNESDDYESVYKTSLRVTSFIQTLALRFCLGIFSKVIHSVGLSDLKDIFNNVSLEIDTPAAKILAFSINTCYGKMSYSELKAIHSSMKNNPVVLRILKARVKSYLYNNDVTYDKKQKIASLLKWKIESNLLPMRSQIK